MENTNTKLQIGDIFVVNNGKYYNLKKGKYKIVGFSKNRLGAQMYKIRHNRKNAAKDYYLYVDDLDGDLCEPKIEDLTSSIGVAFLNLKTVVKYDEELIEKAKKINSER